MTGEPEEAETVRDFQNAKDGARRAFIFLLCLLLIASCSKVDEGAAVQWQALALEGRTLELIDDHEIQVFPFSSEGTSSATIGLKGKAVAAPILFWKIEGNVLRLSVMPDAEIFEELSDPAVKGGIVTATCRSGRRRRFLLSRDVP